MVICNNIEKIENYDKAKLDNFKGWNLHHRLETHFSDGTERPKNAQLSAAELIALDMYYNRPPEELIYLTRKDHNKLHFSGKKHSKETKKKQSSKLKGRIPWNKGKKMPKVSDNTRKKMSESAKERCKNQGVWNKGRKMSDKYKKKMSETSSFHRLKGMHWKLVDGKRVWY